MNRKDLYNEIYQLNLQDEIKNTTGRNFTQVSSAVLESIISLAKEAIAENERTSSNNSCNEALERLVEVLVKKHILLASEVRYIL